MPCARRGRSGSWWRVAKVNILGPGRANPRRNPPPHLNQRSRSRCALPHLREDRNHRRAMTARIRNGTTPVFRYKLTIWRGPVGRGCPGRRITAQFHYTHGQFRVTTCQADCQRRQLGRSIDRTDSPPARFETYAPMSGFSLPEPACGRTPHKNS